MREGPYVMLGLQSEEPIEPGESVTLTALAQYRGHMISFDMARVSEPFFGVVAISSEDVQCDDGQVRTRFTLVARHHGRAVDSQAVKLYAVIYMVPVLGRREPKSPRGRGRLRAVS